MNISITIRGTTFLRIGIALVFLWFGSQQFISPDMWIGFIPQWVIDVSPVGAVTLVHINGALEIVFGTALIFGFFTRISALVLALHMAHITFLVGYDSIGVRDFGLTIAAFSIFLNGADNVTLDQLLFFGQKVSEIPPSLAPTREQYLSGQYRV